MEKKELTLAEKIHTFENSHLVSDNFTQEALTAAYVEALAALHKTAELKAQYDE